MAALNRGIRRFVLAAMLSISGALVAPSSAEAAITEIQNHKNEKVKVCVYRATGKTWLSPIKCVTLGRGGRAAWNRGNDTSSFDVRVFRPSILDVLLCEKRGIPNTSELYIKATAPCISYRTGSSGGSGITVPVRSWKAGDKVIVKRAGQSYWIPARILNRNDSSIYRVRYANGSNAAVQPRYISGDYIRAGTRVEGNWLGKGRWYPGRIVSRNGDTVRIHYDDGDKETTTLAHVRLTYRNLPRPPKNYTLRACNNHDERVWFAISFATGQSSHAGEGWWNIDPGGCINVDLTKRWKMQVPNVPDDIRLRTYIYGETAGLFGGAVKKVWEGSGSGSRVHCINMRKGEYFLTKAGAKNDGSGGVWSNACNARGFEKVRMDEVDRPSSGGTQFRYNFGGR